MTIYGILNLSYCKQEKKNGLDLCGLLGFII